MRTMFYVKRKQIVNAGAVCLFLIGATVLSCGGIGKKAYKRHFFSLDTSIDVTLYASHNPSRVFDSIRAIIFGFDSLLSITDTSGDVWKINHRVGPRVRVHPATAAIISFCNAACDSSAGWFDITVGPLKYLYGLESHQRDRHIPSKGQLDSVCRIIGCGRVRVMGDSAVFLDSGTTVDLGGIAKGFLLERLKRYLSRAGQKDYLINLGGDLIAWGEKPGGKPWIVGVQHPRKPEALLATLPVRSTCVFSSGDYERFFIENGVRYHHLFDPHTGIPCRKNQSSTVIGENSVDVDAQVKEAFFMDGPRALEFLRARHVQGIIVDSLGTVWISESLKNMVTITDSSADIRYK